jgi:hypothetical protein
MGVDSLEQGEILKYKLYTASVINRPFYYPVVVFKGIVAWDCF